MRNGGREEGREGEREEGRKGGMKGGREEGDVCVLCVVCLCLCNLLCR